MAEKGDAKAISFVEDTAVAPERLRDYIAEFLTVIARHGTTAGVYAHASVGCLHVRPVINLKTEEGVRQLRGDRRRGRRPGAQVRRRPLRRARRRPGPQSLSGEDVRPRALPGVSRDQAHLRPAQPAQSRQDRRCPAARVEPAIMGPRIARRRCRRRSTSRPTAAWRGPRNCVPASASAARNAAGRCARRTRRPATNSTAPAAGPTRCGWR